MHGWVASGGVAQYELSEMALQIVQLGPTLTDIDAWVQRVHVPRGMRKLKSTFFQDRIVRLENDHIKVFAAEVSAAIMLVGFFLDAALGPSLCECIQLFVDCFALQRITLAILQKRRHQ